jgi:hypothetical protein
MKSFLIMVFVFTCILCRAQYSVQITPIVYQAYPVLAPNAHVKLAIKTTFSSIFTPVNNYFNVSQQSGLVMIERCYAGGLLQAFCTYFDTIYVGNFSPGTYTVNYKIYFGDNSNECAKLDSFSTQHVFLQHVSVKEWDWHSDISFYPNPVNDFMDVSIPESTRLTGEIVQAGGALVKTLERLESDSISVSELSAGMYWLLLYHEGSIVRRLKFIKL